MSVLHAFSDSLGRFATAAVRPETAAHEWQLCYMLLDLSIDKCVLSLLGDEHSLADLSTPMAKAQH